MPPINNELNTMTQQELKNLYYFLSNNLGQIAGSMKSQQKQDFWNYYQTVEGLHNQALFIGLLPSEEVGKISEQIKIAKAAAEKMLLNMKGIVTNLNAFKAAVDLIQAAKDLAGGGN